MRSLVHDIIGKHSDLMAMFNEFLMRCEVGARGGVARRQLGRGREERIGVPVRARPRSWEVSDFRRRHGR